MFLSLFPIRPAATAVLLAASLVSLAQPAPPAPATPPVPPTPPAAAPGGFKVMTFGSPVSFLGIGVKEIMADRAKELKLKEEAGVEVTRVEEGSPAEQAGLKVGDAVLEYQGNRVEGAEQFVRLVRETPAGRQVRMKIARNGSSQNVIATIASRQPQMWGVNAKDRARIEQEMARVQEKLRRIPEIRVPDVPHALMGWRSGMIGIDGEALDGQLAEFFGAPAGVLVRNVAQNMPAAKAGIKAGDVIVRVDETPVKSPRDITAAIRNSQNRNPLKVTVLRQKSELSLEVTLEQEKPMVPRGVTVSRPQDFEF